MGLDIIYIFPGLFKTEIFTNGHIGKRVLELVLGKLN